MLLPEQATGQPWCTNFVENARETLPSVQNGQHSFNRARQSVLPEIAVGNDMDAIKAWLARYADRHATFESYR
jgi:integrase/recombinase XerD